MDVSGPNVNFLRLIDCRYSAGYRWIRYRTRRITRVSLRIRASQGFLLFLLRPLPSSIPSPSSRLVACFRPTLSVSLYPIRYYFTYIYIWNKEYNIIKKMLRRDARVERSADSSGRRICMGSLRFKNANFLNLCHGNCGVERRKAGFVLLQREFAI